MQGAVPHPQIAPLLQRHFVALASDCDEAEHEVEVLAGTLEDAYMLPFVLIADADGKFLGGSSGAVNPLQLERTLRELVQR